MILGVKIDNLSRKEILEKVNDFLDENKFHQIATINPEFILEAQKNIQFKNTLNECDLSVCDGIGIKFAFWRFGKNLKCRLTGVDLTEEILKIANQKKLGIYLAINKNGLSSYEEIRSILSKKYPDLMFTGSDIDPKDLYIIHNTSYIILLCNFGAPCQELFIKNQKNGKIRLAMGVGGSFDFLVGKTKRAPALMQKIGLEWLWRFLFHSSSSRKFFLKRCRRTWKAVIIFPIKVILNK